MNPEEKLAAQMLLIDEMTRHREDNPTMLIDALLADQGFAFLHHVLTRREADATRAAQTASQLVRALRSPERLRAELEGQAESPIHYNPQENVA